MRREASWTLRTSSSVTGSASENGISVIPVVFATPAIESRHCLPHALHHGYKALRRNVLYRHVFKQRTVNLRGCANLRLVTHLKIGCDFQQTLAFKEDDGELNSAHFPGSSCSPRCFLDVPESVVVIPGENTNVRIAP